jgi:hypothetical protein
MLELSPVWVKLVLDLIRIGSDWAISDWAILNCYIGIGSDSGQPQVGFGSASGRIRSDSGQLQVGFGSASGRIRSDQVGFGSASGRIQFGSGSGRFGSIRVGVGSGLFGLGSVRVRVGFESIFSRWTNLYLIHFYIYL